MRKLLGVTLLLAVGAALAEETGIEKVDCTQMKTYKQRTECLAKQGKTEVDLAKEHGGNDNSPRLLEEVEKLQADRKAEEELTKKRLAKVKDLFSPWDGSSPTIVRATKKVMNDPKSFEHVETNYIVQKDGEVKITMRFRGKNAFGGLVMQTVVGTIDIDTGKLIKFGVQK